MANLALRSIRNNFFKANFLKGQCIINIKHIHEHACTWNTYFYVSHKLWCVFYIYYSFNLWLYAKVCIKRSCSVGVNLRIRCVIIVDLFLISYYHSVHWLENQASKINLFANKCERYDVDSPDSAIFRTFIFLINNIKNTDGSLSLKL